MLRQCFQPVKMAGTHLDVVFFQSWSKEFSQIIIHYQVTFTRPMFSENKTRNGERMLEREWRVGREQKSLSQWHECKLLQVVDVS